jgi:hypothetical protein
LRGHATRGTCSSGAGRRESRETIGTSTPWAYRLELFIIDETHSGKGTAPSYFLEGLLYNLPRQHFGTSYQETIGNALNWLGGLTSEETSKLVCANEMFYLVRDSNVTWAPADYVKFVSAATELWRDW